MTGRVLFPHSLGLFYTAVTQWLGFPHYGDEGKVMGLAPYGDPERHLPAMRRIALADGDHFRLALEYFTHHRRGVEMTWEDGSPTVGRVFSQRLEEELGPARRAGEELSSRHIDAAAALQARLEELVLHVTSSLAAASGSRNLCLAGGVALNAVANGRIRPETAFDELWVQPAAGDSGTAVGAAYSRLARDARRARAPSRWSTPTPGRPTASRSIAAALAAAGPRGRAARRRRRSSPSSPSGSRPATSSAGSRAGWSSGRARSATARSSPTRGAPG